ncbi:hypothetical protein AGMMS50256_30410 [Betaproteobacteria bacterium]|nr:hypothetical protein AGMMS50256_30410 [Betaproteobacteria bacterium]
MSTLHIMLASGENLPNLIPAISSLPDDAQFKADKVLILTSTAMRKNAEVLQQGLLFAGIQDVAIHDEDCPAHDLDLIHACANRRAEEIALRYDGMRHVLNITGGNKLMTVALLLAFQEGNTEIVYCDTENDRIEYVWGNKTKINLPVNVLKLETCLAAQGYALQENEATDVEGILSRAVLTRKLVASAPQIQKLIYALNRTRFCTDRADERNYLRTELEKPNPVEKDLLQDMQSSGLLTSQMTYPDWVADKYLRGGWLEEWCWIVGHELTKLASGEKLEKTRFAIGQKIVPLITDERREVNDKVTNELDAVYIHRNRMLLLECKTSAIDPQGMVSRLVAVGHNVGGRMNDKWLLTSNLMSPIKLESVKKRAEENEVALIPAEELIYLQEKVYRWMMDSKTH